MTEQELKDAITSACEADYKHAMAAPKHRFSRTFRKKIKVLLQPDMGKHTIPALYPVHGRRRVIMVVAVLVLLLGTTVAGRSFFQSLLGKYILTGYTDHVQLNLGESENLEMVAIEDNEKTQWKLVLNRIQRKISDLSARNRSGCRKGIRWRMRFMKKNGEYMNNVIQTIRNKACCIGR